MQEPAGGLQIVMDAGKGAELRPPAVRVIIARRSVCSVPFIDYNAIGFDESTNL